MEELNRTKDNGIFGHDQLRRTGCTYSIFSADDTFHIR
jgi:hypothetical protein